MKREHTRLFIDAIFLGFVGFLAAQVFTFMVDYSYHFFLETFVGYEPGKPLSETARFLIPVSTTIGGLLSGLIVYTLAPEAEGHGTDAAIKAYHFEDGYIRLRVPFVKMLASAITIGSGGSAGREGPVVQISAGIGSIYAKLTKRSITERRLLLLIGMAAGLGAVFRSPIGAAMFAISVLYSEMDIESHAVLFCLLASVTGYVLNGIVVGWEPLFKVHEIPITQWDQYLFFASLGICAGLVAAILPEVFYRLRDFFKVLNVPQFLKPALGGLVVGLLAVYFPQILGGGYPWIQAALDGNLPFHLMLLLIFLKMIALGLTVGSGGSGGVFAPSLFIGAMLGGILAYFFQQPPGPFVVVGMLSVFGAAARVPLATLFMVIEMTGAFHMLGAAALSVVLSYFVQKFLAGAFKYQSLYEWQVPTKFDSPAHRGEFFLDILMGIKVKDIFDPSRKKWVILPEDMAFKDFVKFFYETEQHYFPVVNKEGKLSGIFSINDIREILKHPEVWDFLKIKDVARKKVITTRPSEDIHSAFQKFTIRNIDALPVVSDNDHGKFLGMLSRREVISFYNRRLEELERQKSGLRV
ncbi:chloride channel protein [Thermodesulfatator autotrophicus]|uniref:Chloride channel protein n=1 Tax=Thermodesulfatator autotrophicus TaxID=1795632 RepID=A0A177E4J3_9BACT|nr:chloride channel protein [Thermodesulfatator autotrophicus]OAG26883.1 chloride channel protein [Thermodesulfatator autotrophicus]